MPVKYLIDEFAAAVVLPRVGKDRVVAVLRTVADEVFPAGDVGRRVFPRLRGHRYFQHNGTPFACFFIQELRPL